MLLLCEAEVKYLWARLIISSFDDTSDLNLSESLFGCGKKMPVAYGASLPIHASYFASAFLAFRAHQDIQRRLHLQKNDMMFLLRIETNVLKLGCTYQYL